MSTIAAFICYRQSDGRATAKRLHALLQGQKVPVPAEGSDGLETPVLDIYFDLAAPGVGDWSEVHEPALKRSRALIVICTPGAKLHEGKDDWVHKELDWWLVNRTTPPILIDSLGEGPRYIPDCIASKWPNAQRIEIIENEWKALSSYELAAEQQRVCQQIIGAITYSRDNVIYQELLKEQERRHELEEALGAQMRLSRRLKWSFGIISTVLILALSAGLVADHFRRAAVKISAERETARVAATEQAARAEHQTKLAEQVTIQVSTLKTRLELQLKDAAAASFQRADRLIADAMATSDMRAGQRGFAEGLAHLAQALAYDPADRNARERFFWEAAMRGADFETRVTTLLAPQALSFRPAFSPDGSELALSVVSLTHRCSTLIFDSTNGQLLETLPHESVMLLGRYSPDGRRLIFALGSGPDPAAETTPETDAAIPNFAEVRDRKTGKIVLRLEHGQPVLDAMFDPSGKLVATAGTDSIAKIWDADNAQLRHALSHKAPVGLLSFSADGSTLTTSCLDGVVTTWSVKTGTAIFTIREGNELNRFALSPNGRELLIFPHKSARVWEIRTGKMKREYPQQDGVNYAEFSPDGTRLLTIGGDNVATVWNLDSGKSEVRWPNRRDIMGGGAFSPDGLRVLICAGDFETDDGELSVWSIRSETPLATCNHNGVAFFSAWSPSGLRICAPCMNFETMQFETLLWTQGSTTRFGLFPSTGGNGEGGLDVAKNEPRKASVAISPNGTYVAGINQYTGASLWRTGTGEFLADLPHKRKINKIAFTSDEGQLVSITGQVSSVTRFDENMQIVETEDTSDGELAGWESATGAKLFGHSDPLPIRDFRFSGDGTKVITIGESQTIADHLPKAGGFQARVWDAKSGKLLAALPHKQPLLAASLNSDGTRAITATGVADASILAQEIYAGVIWDVTAREALLELSHQSVVSGVSFSADGGRAVTASADKTAKIWDAVNGRLLLTLSHRGNVSAAKFSPDGKRVLTECEDRAIRLWSADTEENPILVLDHPAMIASSEFANDGSKLLSTCVDGTLRLWDLDSGRILFVREGGTSDAMLQPDGSHVVAGTRNGVEVWNFAQLKPLLDAVADESLIRDFQSISALCSGLEFDRLGRLVSLPREVWQRERDRVSEIAAGLGPLAPLALWLVTPKEDRPPWPGGKTTLRQHVDALIASGGEDALNQAYELSPNHPLIHLALAAHEPDGTRAEFLRRYSLDRLIPRAPPTDRPALLRRAAELLDRQQGQEKRANTLRAKLRSP